MKLHDVIYLVARKGKQNKTTSRVKRESKKTMEKKREKRMRRRCRRSVCGDDFTDVSDDHYLPTLPPPPPPPVPEPLTSDCPVNDYLLKQGFGFKRYKLADCLGQLEDSGFDVPQKADFCIQKFLFSDLNSCGGGILPSDLHLQTFLHGPYVLQVSISIFIILFITTVITIWVLNLLHDLHLHALAGRWNYQSQ